MSDRPPLWAVFGTIVAAPLFIALVIVYVPYTLSGWWFAPAFFGWVPSRWIGVALILIPIPVLLDFLARFVGEGHGTPMPMAPPQRLVLGGSFRFVRNPAYLAAVVTLVGQGLLFASVPILIYAGAMLLVFHAFVVGYEEPRLRREFGAAYDAYCRRVLRWLPRIGRGD